MTEVTADSKASRPLVLFLSYGHDSVEDAEALKADLEARGHTVWMDRERLEPGKDWESGIEEGLRRCDRVILLMTPHAVRRRNPADPDSIDGFCLNEIAKALQCRKEIVPIMLVSVDEGPPTSICRLQWVDMTSCRPLCERPPVYKTRFSELVAAVEKGQARDDGNQALLIRLLRPEDFRAQIEKHMGRFQGRSSIQDHLDEWLQRSDGPQILWIVGGPGEGKTAFAVNVCHKRGDAFYMCERGKNDPRSLVRTIAFQLAMHLPEYAHRLARLPALEADHHDAGAKEVFDDLILAPLTTNSFPEPGRTLLVVIDGLDEATDRGRNELADLLVDKQSQLPRWLRFVVTGREDPELISPMGGVDRIELEQDRKANDAAIRAYVALRLVELGHELDHAKLEALVEKSEGVFLYVVYVMDALQRGECTLEDLPSLPSGLYAWYHFDFHRRFLDIAAYRRDLEPVLQLLVSQRAPLPVSLLQEILGVNQRTLARLRALLGALFVYDMDGQGGSIRLAHASLREWLVGIDERTFVPIAGQFSIDPEEGERLLADHGWKLYEAGSLSASAYQFTFLAEHLAATGRSADLRRLLTDPELLLEVVAQDRRYEWMRQWRRTELEPAPEFEQAVARLEASGASVKHLAECIKVVGNFLRDLGHVRRALPLLERSIELQAGDEDTQTVEFAGSLLDLAELHRIERSFDDSLGLFQRALAIYHRRIGPRCAEVARVYYGLCLLHRDQGRYSEALSYNSRALQLRESVEPIDHRGLADCVNDMGVLLWEKERSKSAEGYYRRALEIGETHWGPQDPQTASFFHNIGRLYKGDAADRDLIFMRRAMKALESTFLPHHRDVQTCRISLASHLAVRGHYLEAIDRMRVSLENSVAAHGELSDQANRNRTVLDRYRRQQVSLAGQLEQARRGIEQLDDTEKELRVEALAAIADYAKKVGGARAAAKREFRPDLRKGLGGLLFQLGAWVHDYGYHAAAVRFLDLARAAEARVVGHPDLAPRMLKRLVRSHTCRDELQAARQCQQCLLELLLEDERPDASALVAIMREMARLAHLAGDHDQALASCRLAVSLCVEAHGEDANETRYARASLAQLLNESAMTLKNQRAAYAEAEKYYRVALEFEPEGSTVLGNLALLLTVGLGRHDEAEECYRKSLQLARDSTRLANYAFFLQHVRRDVASARDRYEEALAEAIEVGACANFAALLLVEGDRERAAELLARANEQSFDPPVQPRLLFVRAALESLEGRDPDFWLGQLRFMLETGHVLSPWKPTAFLEFLESALPSDAWSALQGLAEALADRSALDRLRTTPEWQSSSFVPLDESWPVPMDSDALAG